MARTSFQIDESAHGDRVESEAQGVAVVVGANPAVSATVEGLRLTPVVVPGIERLLERRGESPSLVVVCVDDAIRWLVANVEPMREAIGAQAPVVVICSEVRRWQLRAALGAGVAGVILEAEQDLALAPCIQATLAGQVCVPRRDTDQIEPPALSTREKQILGLVVMGYMNSQIAEQLFVAESTVKSHLSSAFGKLGVRSRNEAVDLILDPERGLGMGILALGGEPLNPAPAATR